MSEPTRTEKFFEAAAIAGRNLSQLANEVAFFLQKFRILPICVLLFVMWMTYDFHQFYKAHALEMKEWQLLAVFAYAGTLLGCIKFMFDHLEKPMSRDEE